MQYFIHFIISEIFIIVKKISTFKFRIYITLHYISMTLILGFKIHSITIC